MGKKSDPKNEMEWFNWFRENESECNLLYLKENFNSRLNSNTLIDKFIVIKSEYEKFEKLTRTYIDPSEDLDNILFLEGVLGAKSNDKKAIEGQGQNIGEQGIYMFTKGWTTFEFFVWIENLYQNEVELRLSVSKKKTVEEIDYPDIKTIKENQKILLLLELGVVDYLDDKYQLKKNWKRIAQILSTITDLKQDTIRQMIRGYKQGTKNNPLRVNNEWLINTMNELKLPLSKTEDKK